MVLREAEGEKYSTADIIYVVSRERGARETAATYLRMFFKGEKRVFSRESWNRPGTNRIAVIDVDALLEPRTQATHGSS